MPSGLWKSTSFLLRSLCVLALFADGAGIVGATAIHPEAWSPVAGYSGKYSGSARFHRIFGRLPDHRRDALKFVEAGIGLRPDRAERIHVELFDARPADTEVIEPFREAPFRTVAFSGGDGELRVVIQLATEFIMNESFDLRTEVIHEMVHAVMCERMGQKTYATVPKWLREGLALWVAGQGERRIDRIVRQRMFAADSSWMMPGLGRCGHDASRYAEDYLAVAMLADEVGDHAVVDLVARLVSGESAFDALAAVTGIDWLTYRMRARRHAFDAVEDRLPTGWNVCVDLLRDARRGRHDAVVRRSREFLYRHQQSTLVPTVLFTRARSLRSLGRDREAKVFLRRLLARHVGESAHDDDTRLALAEIALANRRPKTAIRQLRRVLRDHPAHADVESVLASLADAYDRVGADRRAALTRRKLDNTRWARIKRTALDHDH